MAKTLSKETIVDEMRIPKSVSETLFDLTMYGIASVSVVAGIFCIVFFRNKTLGAGAIPSVIWLGLLYYFVRAECRDQGGLRNYMVNQGGVFARRHFAGVAKAGSEPALLCFGYKLFWRRFYYLKVECDGIKSVDWSGAQGWGMHVVLHYHSSSVKAHRDSLDIGIYIVGGARGKKKTERLGDRLIEFLRKADVPAAQIKDRVLQSMIGKVGFMPCVEPPYDRVEVGGDEYFCRIEGLWFLKKPRDKGFEVVVIDKCGLTLYVVATEEDEEDAK